MKTGISAIDRFMSHVTIQANGCWEWVAAIDARGYGRFWMGGKRTRAHRFSYEYYTGKVPDGKELDHLCRNHACVNPAHLEAVSHKVNVLRGEGVAALHARNMLCSEGHLLTPENVIIDGGGRRCKICREIWKRQYYLAHQSTWNDKRKASASA